MAGNPESMRSTIYSLRPIVREVNEIVDYEAKKVLTESLANKNATMRDRADIFLKSWVTKWE
jgi:hypothetical protein